MVSPCKKKKVEKKGKPPNEPNHSKNTIEPRRLKSSKPLSNKKFYLDIKNHTCLRQIETKLTSLGASLELFLVKDVDCVVTDRDDYPRHSKQHGLVTPSPFCSVSPATIDSPTDGVISKRTRSRAEAMLERVKQQPQKNTIDILDNAIAWRIPIYSLSKFLVWLEKFVHRRNSEPGVRELRGHYLKVETGGGRPDYRHFKVWPQVSYSDNEHSAFLPPKPFSKHDPQRMTRKVGKTGKDGSTAPGGGNGYCEICRVHYDQLDAHVVSSQHTKLVSDPAQYSQLDSLISHHDLGNVTSLRKSLRIAKSPPVEMGGKPSSEPPLPPPTPPTPMNGHITRSRTDKILCNGLSPIEKKKKEIKISEGCSGTSGHNDKPGPKEKCVIEDKAGADHNLRSRHSSYKPSAPQAKKIRQSRKRLSVEEKLIEDNKSYYKVEVLNSKLRSTEYFISQKQLEARVNGGEEVNGCEEKPVDKDVKEPVVVRFKKVRKTELAVLSDEAENFMFGDLTRKENDSKADSDSSEDSGGHKADSDTSSEEEIPRRKRKSKPSYSSDRVESDLPSSTNRHQLICTVPSQTQTEVADEKDEKSEEEYSLKDITFGFEMMPKPEPWMTSYKPVKEEQNFYCPHYHAYPSFRLPYEYPPSERLKLLSSSKGLSYGRQRDRFSRLLDESKPRKSPRCHASTLAIMSSLMRRRPVRECTSNPDFTYEEESRSSLPETIESSSSASDGRSAFTDTSLLPIDPSGDIYAIALARFACGETSTIQVPPGPCLPVDPSVFDDPPPGIECGSQPGLDLSLAYFLDKTPHNKLLDFDFRFHVDDSGSECSDLIGFGDDGRGVSGKRRKRKRNMTGWPVGRPKKKLVKVKEEEAEEFHSPYKLSPCKIKLEPICQDVLERYSFKVEPPFGDESHAGLVTPVKRGRGRPRKYPPLDLPPTSYSSPLVLPKSSPKKKSIPRFTFGPRRSCIK